MTRRARRSTRPRRCWGSTSPAAPRSRAWPSAATPGASASRARCSRAATLDFSFSGLKTAALTARARELAPLDEQARADLAAGFQAAIVDVLAAKCGAALEREGLDRLVVAGGVGANAALRSRLTDDMREATAARCTSAATAVHRQRRDDRVRPRRCATARGPGTPLEGVCHPSALGARGGGGAASVHALAIGDLGVRHLGFGVLPPRPPAPPHAARVPLRWRRGPRTSRSCWRLRGSWTGSPTCRACRPSTAGACCRRRLRPPAFRSTAFGWLRQGIERLLDDLSRPVGGEFRERLPRARVEAARAWVRFASRRARVARRCSRMPGTGRGAAARSSARAPGLGAATSLAAGSISRSRHLALEALGHLVAVVHAALGIDPLIEGGAEGIGRQRGERRHRERRRNAAPRARTGRFSCPQ